jgi:hypothetical protein
MERSCSCAAPHIFSAETCIVFPKKAVFRAFYSPDPKFTVYRHFSALVVTPNQRHTNKINWQTAFIQSQLPTTEKLTN